MLVVMGSVCRLMCRFVGLVFGVCVCVCGLVRMFACVCFLCVFVCVSSGSCCFG